MRTTIYLVRHAHAERRPDENRPLSPSGTQSASTLAERLAAFPITAIYSSPARRSIETVAPLGGRLQLEIHLIGDLREREVPIVPASEFERLIEARWRDPLSAAGGGESNLAGRARGLAALQRIATVHAGEHLVVATHGNLLALTLNALDESFGYAFWRQMSFPDAYRLELEDMRAIVVTRLHHKQ